MHEIPQNLSPRELRKFGITTGLIIAVLFGIGFPWILDRPSPWWPWILSGILIVWGLAAPASLGPVYRGWMRFGLIMSKITTPILLGILFYIVVLPTGLIRRMMGLDSMARRFDETKDTYRIASRKDSGQHLKRPF